MYAQNQIIHECFVAIKSKVLNRITKNQLRLPLSERGDNINEWGRVRFSTKNSFIFMVNCCTLSTNSVLINCAKGMVGGGCVGGFFFTHRYRLFWFLCTVGGRWFSPGTPVSSKVKLTKLALLLRAINTRYIESFWLLWKYFIRWHHFVVVSTKCIDPWVLELVVSNNTGNI